MDRHKFCLYAKAPSRTCRSGCDYVAPALLAWFGGKHLAEQSSMSLAHNPEGNTNGEKKRTDICWSYETDGIMKSLVQVIFVNLACTDILS